MEINKKNSYGKKDFRKKCRNIYVCRVNFSNEFFKSTIKFVFYKNKRKIGEINHL